MRLAIIPLVLLSTLAFAQTPGAGDAQRGSIPQGMSQDGARPADGAIKGGTILPGEQGGIPGDKDKASAAGGGSAERRDRCNELEGSLREDCLAKERKAGEAEKLPAAK